MPTRGTELSQGRRQFITALFPACALFGLKSFAQESAESTNQPAPFAERIKKDFCQSYEETWRARYGFFINIFKRLAEELGKDNLLALLKKAVDGNYKSAGDNPNNTFDKYVNAVTDSDFFKTVTTIEVVERSEKACELKVHECIWAKTFLEQNAGDIGYMLICHGDYGHAQAYNAKLKLTRTKTLMQGNDCCNHRYTWEA